MQLEQQQTDWKIQDKEVQLVVTPRKKQIQFGYLRDEDRSDVETDAGGVTFALLPWLDFMASAAAERDGDEVELGDEDDDEDSQDTEDIMASLARLTA